MSRMVIALGGNSLGVNLSDQMKAVQKTSKKIVELFAHGHEVVLTHGNGPQVGLMLDCFDSYMVEHNHDAFTMSVCVSITQGYIGYDLQNVMREALLDIGLNIPVTSVITQVIVDKDDPAFSNPTKPIGPFLTEQQAEQSKQRGESVAFVDNRGFRRVVASPRPQHIVEIDTIKALLDAGQVVIACGGGGIPVIEQGNHLKGVPAIIDKDYSSAKLAKLIHADYFVILTEVEQVYVDFGKPTQKAIDTMTCAQAQAYIDEGRFGEGSMLPKVRASMQAVTQTPGCTALITSLDKLLDGLKGETGTRITP